MHYVSAKIVLFRFGLDLNILLIRLVKLFIEPNTDPWKLLEQKYWHENEEFITELFHGEWPESLEKACQSKKSVAAFLSDIQNQFPELEYLKYFQDIANDIEASTTGHARHIESKTDRHFELLVIRPSIKCTTNRISINRTFINDNNLIFRLNKDYFCSFICRAKFKGYSIQKRWNSLPEATWLEYTILDLLV